MGTPSILLHGTNTLKEASAAFMLIPSTSMCLPPVASISLHRCSHPTSNNSSPMTVNVLTIRPFTLTNLPRIKSLPTASIELLSTSLPPGHSSSVDGVNYTSQVDSDLVYTMYNLDGGVFTKYLNSTISYYSTIDYYS